ncbi:MAG: XRE family transcriptional regulator [Desulfobacteraceae bacterium]|nr:MAG: XRE family transcriptional regulator [Desulfobacteraceae bacterium]
MNEVAVVSNRIFAREKAVTRTLPCLRLRNELWKRGIRQIDLAYEIKINPSRLSKYINGWEEMPGKVKKAISDWLEMPEAELFT